MISSGGSLEKMEAFMPKDGLIRGYSMFTNRYSLPAGRQ